MKKIIAFALCLASICNLQTRAQSVTIYLKDGNSLQYNAGEVDYIQFSDQDITEFNILTEKYVPDYTLRTWIDNTLANGSGVYTNKQAEEYTGSINLTNQKTIRSLEGLEFFTNATSLILENCSAVDGNTLPELEHITYLNCSYTRLDEFDVFSMYPNLETLNISGCNFSGAIAFTSEKIKRISCSQINGMVSLDVSGCSSLTELVCSYGSLTSINLGNAPITGLYCHQNPQLGQVDFNNVRSTLKQLNVSYTGISTLDLSGCSELSELECQGNRFTTTPDFNGCTALMRLRCEDTGITSLDVTSLVSLTELHCYNNSITALDLSGLCNLQMVNAFNNNIETINVDGCTSMFQLSLYSNDLTHIDLTGCSQETLTDFGCEDNPVTEIRVWTTFDINNPPASWYKPETASYVYEFSQEPGTPENPEDPGKEYVSVNFSLPSGYEHFITKVTLGTDMLPVENWKNGIRIEKGEMLAFYGDNFKYNCTDFTINGTEESWWGYWWGNIEDDTVFAFEISEKQQLSYSVDIDNAEAVTLYLENEAVSLTNGINNLKFYEGCTYLYAEPNEGWQITSASFNSEEVGGSGTYYFPPLSENAVITITTAPIE